MKDIIVYGAGGLGREILWLINKINKQSKLWNIVGIIDDSPELSSKIISEVKVLGNKEFFLNNKKNISVVCAIGNSNTRKKVVDFLSSFPNIDFPSLISPDVDIASCNKIGKGCVIFNNNIITINVEIGDFVCSYIGNLIAHDSCIGDFSTLYANINISGNVIIGSCVEIGTGTNIIQGKCIGDNSIIGAGSVVISDIPANCVAVGTPAKPIKFKENIP